VLARYQGHQSAVLQELATQDMYFAFLVIQVFLVVSVSSQATVIVSQLLNNPASITQTLATNLPRSSNFFYSFLLLQGLTITSGSLLQIITLSIYLFRHLFNSTPRARWKRQHQLQTFLWSSNLPMLANLSTIGGCHHYA